MRAGRPSASDGLHRLQQTGFQFRLGVAGLGGAGGLVEPLLDAGQVGETELDADDLAVTDRIHASGDMLHVGIVEAADHVHDGVNLANVGEELVPQPLSLARSLHQSGDIEELDRRGDRLLWLDDSCEGVESGVRDGDDAGIGFDGGERIIRHQCTGAGQGIEEGGLADVG